MKKRAAVYSLQALAGFSIYVLLQMTWLWLDLPFLDRNFDAAFAGQGALLIAVCLFVGGQVLTLLIRRLALS